MLEHPELGLLRVIEVECPSGEDMTGQGDAAIDCVLLLDMSEHGNERYTFTVTPA